MTRAEGGRPEDTHPSGRTTAPVPQALVRRARQLASTQLDAHVAEYLPSSWRTKVADADVVVLTNRFPDGRITRGDLFELGRATADGGPQRRQLLLATLMWGYGKKGGRPYRNALRVLRVERLDERLASTGDRLQTGDLRGAYREVSGIAGYGEGFFTKYLYFAASGLGWDDDRPLPLIFDSVARTNLAFLADVLGVDWMNGRRRLPPAEQYSHYCSTLHDWARYLSADDIRCTPDQIEHFLFSGELMFDIASRLRALTAAAVTDIASGQAGRAVQATVAGLPRDLVESVTVEGPT